MLDVAQHRAGVLWRRGAPRPARTGRLLLSDARTAGIRAWQDEDEGAAPLQRDREWQVIRDRGHEPIPEGDRPPTLVVVHRHEWTAHRVPALLDGCGVTVHLERTDPSRAMGVIVVEQPDVVLMSETLPGMRGLDVAARIRALSPASLVAVQVDSQTSAHGFQDVSDAIFSRWCALATIATTLRELLPA